MGRKNPLTFLVITTQLILPLPFFDNSSRHGRAVRTTAGADVKEEEGISSTEREIIKRNVSLFVDRFSSPSIDSHYNYLLTVS